MFVGFIAFIAFIASFGFVGFIVFIGFVEFIVFIESVGIVGLLCWRYTPTVSFIKLRRQNPIAVRRISFVPSRLSTR